MLENSIPNRIGCRVGDDDAGCFVWNSVDCSVSIYCNSDRVVEVARLAQLHGNDLGKPFHRVSEHFLEIQKQIEQIDEDQIVNLETSFGDRLIAPEYCTPDDGGRIYFYALSDPLTFEAGLGFIRHEDVLAVQPTNLKVPPPDPGW